MNKTRLLWTVALPIVLGVVSAGCSTHREPDLSKEWTPAKSGMSREQFFKIANEKMKSRQGLQAQPGGPPVGGPPATGMPVNGAAGKP